MVGFINDHRGQYGVESICAVLPIAPSTYFRHQAGHADPTRRAARAQRDDELREAIQRVWHEHYQVYGPRKVWRQLQRDGVCVARCTVRRLMRAMGLQGAVRGRAWVTTTQPAITGARPTDLVERDFTATRPNEILGRRLQWPLGAGLSTWRSSSMSLPGGLSGGACRRRCGRTLCWTRWSRPSTTAGAPR